MARLALDDVSLTFTLRNRSGASWKDWALSKLTGRPGTPRTTVQALSNVSFELADGERLGVIGHNGAGKTTLLRVLAGIYCPTLGRRLVEGRISALFELGLGFEPEATGWENIRYRGYLQKETPRSIGQKVEAIAAFTELGDKLDMPIRYYSSGMLVRLAFSIATAIEPEILLIDEVLAAGDMAFQAKALARMRALMARARAIVLVSHEMKTIAEMCDRVLWLDQGRPRLLGPVRETLDAYKEHMGALAAAAVAKAAA
jgi:ABC-type polysaccharide/polyol phosphate transport system ATPase subunit